MAMGKSGQSVAGRQIPSGLLIVLLLASGCATTGPTLTDQPSQVSSLTEQMAVAVNDENRKRCEELARAETAEVKGGSVGGAFTGGLLAPLSVGPYGIFLGAILGPMAAVSQAQDNARVRQFAFDDAMQRCLEPARLAETLGPDHPEVASSLHRVAERFVAKEKYGLAEPPYRRALAIREQVLGPGHPDVAATLDAYAFVLRKLNREAEAEEMTIRAQQIRPTPTPGPPAEAP